eukprot:Trichotokara_eunicae@DN4115_c0_g1_i1.p1
MGQGTRPDYSARDAGKQIFVGNLPFRTSWQDLKDVFRDAGHVVRTDIFTDNENRSKGCGIVIFETPREAQAAVERFNNFEISGRPISVRLDDGPRKRY